MYIFLSIGAEEFNKLWPQYIYYTVPTAFHEIIMCKKNYDIFFLEILICGLSMEHVVQYNADSLSNV